MVMIISTLTGNLQQAVCLEAQAVANSYGAACEREYRLEEAKEWKEAGEKLRFPSVKFAHIRSEFCLTQFK
jgi:hypothetical protein